MPELLTDREAEPQRPDWLADDAVRGEPVSAVKTGTSRTGLRRAKTEAGTAPAALARVALMRTRPIIPYIFRSKKRVFFHPSLDRAKGLVPRAEADAGNNVPSQKSSRIG